jgi:parallel beta-helix repeat protein
VSPSGSDNNNGSADAPWKTLQHAADTVVAGDTVTVRAGEYAGFVMGWDSDAEGTESSPITFKAKKGAVINSRNARTPDGINLEGVSHVIIKGFKIVNTTETITRAGIRSVTNHHVTIKDNRIDKAGRWGVFTGFSDDVKIEGNRISRSAIEHGIYVSNSGDRPVIRGNTIWANRANGIHMNGDESQGGDGIISDALVENNTIYENGIGGGSGINCDGVQRSIIRNNLLYDNHASGISLYRIDGADGSKKNRVINNTIIVASDGRWALNIRDGSTGNTVYNNILHNKGSYRGSISISEDSLSEFVSDYNVIMSRFTTDDGNSVQSLSQWRSRTGQDRHSIAARPTRLFVDFGGHDYHLSVSSPAINIGTMTRSPSRDLEGVSRRQGLGVDIGAFENEEE